MQSSDRILSPRQSHDRRVRIPQDISLTFRLTTDNRTKATHERRNFGEGEPQSLRSNLTIITSSSVLSSIHLASDYC